MSFNSKFSAELAKLHSLSISADSIMKCGFSFNIMNIGGLIAPIFSTTQSLMFKRLAKEVTLDLEVTLLM